jgi:ABC-type transport system involved in multi-copper enzyme maturation permease subunit
MRPYWTILRDSFHEAMVSRVLWVLLVFITLFLAALAPIGVTDQAGFYLSDDEISDPAGLIRLMKSQSEMIGASPGSRIWSRLNDDLRKRLESPPPTSDTAAYQWAMGNRLREELNRMLAQRDFYDEKAWEKTPVRREARDLLSRGLDTLPSDELSRFNRLALEAAYPGYIAAIGRKQTRFTYAGYDISIIPPMDLSTLRLALNGTLQTFMHLLLGVGGVIVAIIVTSPIIPHTYEPGAIDLLLSKPVSRSLVFLTKFFGGCAFTGLNAAYMIGGLWLILGVRLGVWNQKLLWCIPLYLFLFSIYYAVSGIVGLLWRNAIISVVMTVVFWGVCFSLGVTKGLLEQLLMNPQRVIQLIPADETLLASNQQGQLLRWADDQKQWVEIFSAGGQQQRFQASNILGMTRISPVYDPRTKRLLAIVNPSNGNPLWIGRQDQGWRRSAGASLPSAAEALFLESDGSLLAVSPLGVFRMQGDAESKPKTAEILGFKIPLKDNGGRFVEASPMLPLYTPLSAAQNLSRNEMAMFDGRKLLLLEEGKNDAFRVRKELDFDPPQIGLVAYSGSTLMLAFETGEVRIYDPSDLKLLETFEAEKKSPPRMAIASPDGRWFAVVYHDGRMWLYDAKQREVCKVPISGQGNISAVTFNEKNRLLVVDRLTRVTEYVPADWKLVSRLEPTPTFMEGAYRYSIEPLYRVFPKPGELNDLVLYILTDENTVPIGGASRDLRAARQTIDVSGIIWSNLAFLAVVLGIGCVYVAKKDF